MKSFQFSLLTLALASVTLFSGCDDDHDDPITGVSTVDLEFDNKVGTADLTLDTGTYTTAAGDQFKVNTFKYILSNFVLTKADGSTYAVPDSYFLLDQAIDATRHVALANVPAGDYNKVSFVVGVDSARNVSGAQQGALRTDNDMYWSWNSGYIYTKLEGTSPQSPQVGQALVYHIGGFKAPNSCIRTVALPLPSTLRVRTDHHPEVHVVADVLKMFSGPNPVRFATLSNTMGGPNAVKIADNYASPTGGMFTVSHVHGN